MLVSPVKVGVSMPTFHSLESLSDLPNKAVSKAIPQPSLPFFLRDRVSLWSLGLASTWDPPALACWDHRPVTPCLAVVAKTYCCSNELGD